MMTDEEIRTEMAGIITRLLTGNARPYDIERCQELIDRRAKRMQRPGSERLTFRK